MRLSKRLWLLHIAFLVILAGALVTCFTAKESTLMLRADHPVKRYGLTVEILQPDTLRINGADYFIAVNHPVTVGQCRLYQQSYLPEGVSMVSIRKDLIGTGLVFLGFALFFLGGKHIITLLILGFISFLLADSPLLQHAHWASMAFLAAAIAFFTLKYKDIRPYALLAAAAFAVVAALQAVHTPQGPAMPALQSPWLALHVAIVMLSYALFIIITIKALRGQRPRRPLAMAVWLLGIGIATGSVWANESWGRYWSWDPKETFALITFILYAIPLHLRHPRPWHFIAPLPALLLTWFGVSILPSLHAY